MLQPRTITVATAAFLALLVLGGCAEAQKARPTSRTDNGQSATTESPTPEPAGVSSIGPTHGFTYEDGLEVTVVSLQRYRIGQYAAGGKPGDIGVKVLVKVTNGAKEPIDLTLMQVNCKAGPDGTQADSVFDNGITGFQGSVAPGRSASATYAFAVKPADLGQVVIEVTPSFEYDASLFEGAVR